MTGRVFIRGVATTAALRTLVQVATVRALVAARRSAAVREAPRGRRYPLVRAIAIRHGIDPDEAVAALKAGTLAELLDRARR